MLHDLPGDAQTDAAARGFCGEERHENLSGLIDGNGLAVVAYVDADGIVGHGVGREGDGGGIRLYGILQQIGYDVGDEAFVGI